MYEVKINKKDIEILKFINLFGKSFADVLGNTFFNTTQQARDRLVKIKKMGLIRYKSTGLMKPRNAIFLTAEAKTMLIRMGENIKDGKITISSLEHNMLEQIAFYWLGKIGDIDRALVYRDNSTLRHIPDMILKINNKKINVEVEITQKSKTNYKRSTLKMSEDNPYSVLYICMNKKKALTIAKSLPSWDKFVFIDIETLICNIKSQNRVGAMSQRKILGEGG